MGVDVLIIIVMAIVATITFVVIIFLIDAIIHPMAIYLEGVLRRILCTWLEYKEKEKE